MLPYKIIEKKAGGHELSADEIQQFVVAYTRGSLPDYQMSALLMAIFIQGMTPAETLALTEVMLESGKQMDFSDLDGFVADKHSTGGVGDKTSLILAPVLAELGVHVPMISGRGLGHTGGTLDKLEAIPGFNVNQPLEAFDRLVREHQVGLIGQTENIAPADRKLYSLRDVTATVRSIPLITASIMSKKIAEGIQGLILDVKTGNGAFMQSMQDARALAQNLVEVGERYGIRTTALITDMNQPLGNAIGNWLEVKECLDVLQGGGPRDLVHLSLALGAEILQMRDEHLAPAAALAMQQELLENGRAYDRFLDLCKLHGADTAVLEHPDNYPATQFNHTLTAQGSGYVSRIETMALGFAGITLKAGRRIMSDTIDYAAGMQIHKKLGDKVQKGEPLLILYAEEEELLNTALEQLSDCFTISRTKPNPPQLIYETVSKYYFFGKTQLS